MVLTSGWLWAGGGDALVVPVAKAIALLAAILGLDALYLTAMLLLLVTSGIPRGQTLHFEAVLVIGLLGLPARWPSIAF